MAIGKLQAIVLALVVIGLVLGIGFLVIEEFKGTLDDESATVTAETVAAVTNAGKFVSKNSTTFGMSCYNTFVPTTVVNASTGYAIHANNYSYDTSTGRIYYALAANNAFVNNTNWNVTYTYEYGLDSCGGIESTIEAVKKIPTWLTIVVILLIVGILLTIVFKTLPRGTEFTGYEAGATGMTAEI